MTVHPDSAQPGGYARLTFRVPTESATASTAKLVVTLPQDTSLAGVSTKPGSGWTARIAEDRLPNPQRRRRSDPAKGVWHVVTWKATSARVVALVALALAGTVLGGLVALQTAMAPAARPSGRPAWCAG